MIPGCISKNMFFNDSIIESDFTEAPLAQSVFYDVIRVKKGIPLFFNAHADRFFSSFVLSDLPLPFRKSFLKKAVESFIEKENIEDGNIRLVFYNANPTVFCIYQIAHSYPSAEMYKKGVEADFLLAERKDPNIKQELYVRKTANEIINQKKVYDVVFVNSLNQVTEGSRTNVFFVKNSIIYTAPAQDVLCGITRKKLLEIAGNRGIDIIEQTIDLQNVASFDAAFFTGTSPEVLPINRIGDIRFNVPNDIVDELIKAFKDKITLYLEEYKKS